MSTLVKTNWHLVAEAYCQKHSSDHHVTGTATEKRHIGSLKNDLMKILRDDFPDCHLQPKAKIANTWEYYRYTDEKGEEATKWVQMQDNKEKQQ